MHPEKSQLFTTVILTGSRWTCLAAFFPEGHGMRFIPPLVQQGLDLSPVWNPGKGMGPCPRSRHIHCWRSRYSLPYSTHTKGGREIFKIFEERNMPTCPACRQGWEAKMAQGAKVAKKGGDISSLTSVLNISYPSRGLSTTTVWFLTVTEIESYGRCAIRRCFRTFHIA